jgi:CxxC motif-containing protein (DUF1111 family)
MSKTPETTVIPPIPRGSTSMWAEAAGVRHPHGRWWVMTGLIVLITASAVGWLVAVGAYLRGRAAGARPVGMAPVQQSDAGRGAGAEAPTATCTAATDLPGPAPDPGHPSGRAEDSPAPGPKQDAAEPPPRVSMLLNPGPVPARPAADAEAPAAGDPQSLGRELFARKWLPDDPRCHGGDGLGPLYNADSCLTCHNSGGAGGAGAASANVEVATPIGFAGPPEKLANFMSHQLAGRIGADRVANLPEPTGTVKIYEVLPEPTELVKIHPGFRDATSLVLHHFGVDPAYSQWLATAHSLSGKQGIAVIPSQSSESLPDMASFNRQCRPVPASSVPAEIRARAHEAGQKYFDELGINGVAVTLTARNPPALFGAGLIDRISDTDLETEALRQPQEVRGRVHRMKDGRIGRFGWKAQVTSLEDFVLNACANELGLEVPGHHQAASPLEPAAQARGMDLTPGECNALVAYVRGLPSPVLVVPPGPRGSALIAEGRRLFQSIGCATCHAPDLGPVRGIYSDLLLHDMGKVLSDPGNSYSDDLESRDTPKRGEWRTPPLWGFRDSGPYLHDGRAPDLEHTVALHGGQAAASALEFRTISPSQRSLIHTFLNSLAAPGSAGSPEVSRTAETEARAAETEARDVERTWTEEVVRRAASRLHTAEMLEKMGKTQGALEFYQAVVREAPDSVPGRTAARRISRLGGKLPREP